MAAQAVRWSGIPVDAYVFEPRLLQRLAICRQRLHRSLRGAQGVLPIRVGGATSQWDLPSLTPFSVARYDRLQLGDPHLATSVN